jgi:dipeptidyl aminopeptidase/acylaminoacyl peptidase
MVTPTMRARFCVALTACLAALSSTSVEAQYFGQNQVQHRDFDFRVLKTEHFDIYYYPEEEEQIRHVARLAERWRTRLATLFGEPFRGRQPIVFYASGADFRQTNVVQGIGEGTGGVTEGQKRRIVMPSAGPLAETSHVLGHELVHAFQYDRQQRSRQSRGGFMRLPLWFVEGLAEYLSIGPVDSQTAMWLRDALESDKLPTLQDLGNPRFFPYRFGHAFWAYVGGRWGDEQAINVYLHGMRSGDPVAAIKNVLGQDQKTFSEEWKQSVQRTYAGFLEAAKDPAEYGPLLVGEKRGGGEINLGPALSPDGKRIVYLSERDLFSIDLFLADAETGKVIRKLASTATDPHFDSLQFLESAGAWSADGRRFVQAALRKGRGAFFVLDTASGRTLQEADLPEISEILNPVFTPDARRVVFSGMVGGLVDLWSYDLGTRQLTRHTEDAFAELHPAVSPDGRSVAIATDRFSTKLEDLDFGSYGLALLDLAGGTVRQLAGYPGARHSNPQWAPDGRSLYFLSDVGGATNVHRLDLATGELRQVTELRTGVTGITPLSPSLSVAARSGRVAYSAREDGKLRIYAIDDPVRQAGAVTREGRAATAEARSGTSAPGSSGAAGAGELPPVERKESRVEQLLEDPRSGLPERATGSTEPYDPKIGLTWVGQPSIGVGVDRFGTFVGGSTAFYFSDMLGNRNLSLAFQSFGGLQDIAGQAVYANLTKRFDWAVGAEYIPYLYAGAFDRALVQGAGEPVIVDTYVLERQTNAALFAVGSYPWSRTNRFELTATARRYGFSRELRQDVYSALDGRFLSRDEEDVETGFEPLYLASVAGALVHDSSVFGATSPILGMRARLEAAPTLGTVRYTDVLADWRGYAMPLRPLTFAARLLHFGRYGSGAEDPRFGSMYLGYSDVIRGYDDVQQSECVPDGTSSGCPAFERLFGSRMLVGNVELRAPLWGLIKGRLDYGPLPIELVLFADAGVAWSGGQKPELFGGDRELLTSAGAAARVNLLGFLVAQVSIARPFQREGVGWIWQWTFAPGF